MYANHSDEYFYQRAAWYLKFAWLPHRCALTNNLIWLRQGYKGIAMWTGPGSPVFETKWICKEQFLFAKFRGSI